MAQTIVDLNGRVADLTSRNTEMATTISKLENMVEILNEKVKNLEVQLENERKLRSSDSDSSNSPPLIKKWYISN